MTAATQAFVVIGSRYNNGVRQTVGTTVTLCARHAATVRSLITRGTRGYDNRTYRDLTGIATVEVAAANREAIGAAAAEGYDKETRDAEQARRQYIADNRGTMQEVHLATTTSTGSRSVSVTTLDEYGRSFVAMDYRNITPGQAEALAAALLAAAARARTRTTEGNNNA
jgi:hypothetical protein